MELLIFGILLGLGAAIPIGPVNLEMVRRNLRFGTASGVALGLGACSADVTYLILLCLGTLSLLQYPEVLRVIGFVGSLVLAYFAIAAFRAKTTDSPHTAVRHSLWKHGMEGYLMTLINPFTILFWASVTSQITIAASKHSNIIFVAGGGVIIGTVGWVIFLNTIIHVTRHRLNSTVIQWLNYLGGFILLGFAIVGIFRVIM
jgi:L-lysine exporter family protein LysE/ArgO